MSLSFRELRSASIDREQNSEGYTSNTIKELEPLVDIGGTTLKEAATSQLYWVS